MASATAALKLPVSALPDRARLESRAVIHAGTQNRQSQGHVHRIAEADVLDDRQSLVVVHGDDDIDGLQEARREGGVGGDGSLQVHALGLKFGNHRLDYV